MLHKKPRFTDWSIRESIIKIRCTLVNLGFTTPYKEAANTVGTIRNILKNLEQAGMLSKDEFGKIRSHCADFLLQLKSLNNEDRETYWLDYNDEVKNGPRMRCCRVTFDPEMENDRKAPELDYQTMKTIFAYPKSFIIVQWFEKIMNNVLQEIENRNPTIFAKYSGESRMLSNDKNLIERLSFLNGYHLVEITNILEELSARGVIDSSVLEVIHEMREDLETFRKKQQQRIVQIIQEDIPKDHHNVRTRLARFISNLEKVTWSEEDPSHISPAGARDLCLELYRSGLLNEEDFNRIYSKINEQEKETERIILQVPQVYPDQPVIFATTMLNELKPLNDKLNKKSD